MNKDDVYLIWSNEHGAWWGPGRHGYVQRIEDAGTYSRASALQICVSAMPGRFKGDPVHELPVRLADLEFMLERFSMAYPGHDPEPTA